MDEKTLLKISLITSIAGTVLLFFVSLDIKYENDPFQLSDDGDYITISGRVGRIRSGENVTFLTIYQTAPVTAVIFGGDYLNLAEGDYVEMRGNVQNYKGKKEFIAEEIRKN